MDNKSQPEELGLTIVYDNNSYDRRLETDWGFSCLLEYKNNNILFDTGGNDKILLYNMDQLGIDIDKIGIIFLSHNHYDHTGGLIGFLKKNNNVKVYYPSSFPKSFSKVVRDTGAEVFTIDAFREILPGIYTTGELGTTIKEQSLIANTSKGLVLITGCSHPGIDTIVNRVRESLPGRDIYMLIGGWHLGDASEGKLNKIYSKFSKSGVISVAPCHCSGETTRLYFKNQYKEAFIKCGVGYQVDIIKDE